MTKLFMLMLLAAVAPSLSIAASFDCSKAKSIPEKLICNDQELSRLDDELSAIYLRAKGRASDQATFKKQTTAAWKWRETNCNSKECLMGWYAQRKEVLLKIADPNEKTRCFEDGPIKLNGIIESAKIITEPSGKPITVYLLKTREPVCIHIEPIDAGVAKDLAVGKFQLVSYQNQQLYKDMEKYTSKSVVVEGSLSTNNFSQYYAVSNAIDISSINLLK